MEQSILISTKKILGIAEDYDAFDLDILTWINSAVATLRDFGLGEPGFLVIDNDQTWEMLGEDLEILPMIKTYIFLRVQIMFDPPSTSFVLSAKQDQIREQEFRLSNHREARDWTNPAPARTSDRVLNDKGIWITDPEEVEHE